MVKIGSSSLYSRFSKIAWPEAISPVNIVTRNKEITFNPKILQSMQYFSGFSLDFHQTMAYQESPTQLDDHVITVSH